MNPVATTRTWVAGKKILDQKGQARKLGSKPNCLFPQEKTLDEKQWIPTMILQKNALRMDISIYHSCSLFFTYPIYIDRRMHLYQTICSCRVYY
jgi:hypothetical protein